jgi:hypothetical protein
MTNDLRYRVTPKLIIEQILAMFHADIKEGMDTSFVPNVFWVYLHRETLERLSGLEEKIREQAVRGLHREFNKLNRLAGLPLIKFRAPTVRFERLGEWRIEFRPNEDEEAELDEVLVHTESQDDLGGTENPQLDGIETVRVKVAGSGEDEGTKRTTPSRHPHLAGPAYAFLKYTDDTGEQTYPITKELVKIGRGGKDYWVDLKLVGKKDISQEHCQIRRDPSTGQFFIKDMSRFGTLVNGKRVAPSVDRSGSELRDRHIEEPLVDGAIITLADILSLNFKVVRK